MQKMEFPSSHSPNPTCVLSKWQTFISLIEPHGYKRDLEVTNQWRVLSQYYIAYEQKGKQPKFSTAEFS